MTSERIVARARLNYNTVTGIFGVLAGALLMFGRIWPRPNLVLGAVFVVAGLVIAIRSLLPHIVFSSDGIAFRGMSKKSEVIWQAGQKTRVVYRNGAYLTRAGINKRGGFPSLESMDSQNGHGIALPQGRYTNQSRWSQYLLDRGERGLLALSDETRSYLEKLSEE